MITDEAYENTIVKYATMATLVTLDTLVDLETQKPERVIHVIVGSYEQALREDKVPEAPEEIRKIIFELMGRLAGMTRIIIWRCRLKPAIEIAETWLAQLLEVLRSMKVKDAAAVHRKIGAHMEEILMQNAIHERLNSPSLLNAQGFRFSRN